MPRKGECTPPWDRFWPKVDATGDCWEWTATRDKDGYGKFREGSTGSRNVMAHRWAWEALVGPIPSGMEVDHMCYHRCCVNPDHLRIVTQMENIQGRRFSAAQAESLKTECPKGHPYTPENTILRPKRKPGQFGRVCRICYNSWQRDGYHKRKQKQLVSNC